MQPARIAELLTPFLSAGLVGAMAKESKATPNPCHSEPPRSGGEEPAVLSPTQLQNISTYIDLLLRWNARINLTAIRSEEEIVARHFGESLFAARHLLPPHAGAEAFLRPAERTEASAPPDGSGHAVRDRRGRAALQGRVEEGEKGRASAPVLTLADIGSGAGFPGIPMKLWAPDISLTLIESNHKKATFLREVTRALTLTDVNILTARAESLRDLSFDLITLRAVERLTSMLPAAAGLLAANGRLALLIGASQLGEARATLPNLSWSMPLPIPLSRERILAVAQRK